MVNRTSWDVFVIVLFPSSHACLQGNLYLYVLSRTNQTLVSFGHTQSTSVTTDTLSIHLPKTEAKQQLTMQRICTHALTSC